MRWVLALSILLAGGLAGAQSPGAASSGAPIGSIGSAPTSRTTAPPATPVMPTPGSAQGQNTPAPPAAVTLPPRGVPPTPAPAFPGLPSPSASGPGPGFAPTIGTGNESAGQLRPSAQPSASEIADAQSLLSADGFFHGIIDGTMSGTTRAAVRAFQEAARLPATGELDTATAAALGLPTATAITAAGAAAGTTAGTGTSTGATTALSAGPTAAPPAGQLTTGVRSASPAPFPLSGPIPMSPASQQPPIFVQP